MSVLVVTLCVGSSGFHLVRAQEAPSANQEFSPADRFLGRATGTPAPPAPPIPQLTGRSWSEIIAEYRHASEKRDYDTAIQLMNLLLQEDLPKWQAALVLTNRAISYVDKEEWDKAMQDFDQALRFEPHYPPAYSARAAAWRHKGDLDAALADLNETIRIDPKLPPPYVSRGWIFAHRHQSREALTDFNKAIQLDPKRAVAYGMRAALYLCERENQKAIADARRSRPRSTAVGTISSSCLRLHAD